MTTYADLDKTLTFAESNLKDQVRRFGEEVLRPAAATLDPLPPEEVIAEGSVFWDVFRKAYQLGFHTSGLPEALGGVEISPLGRHIYAEEMVWASADLAIRRRGGAIVTLRTHPSRCLVGGRRQPAAKRA